MKDVSPWLVRKKPGEKKRFEVVSYTRDKKNSPVIAGEFKDMQSAQRFADEANRMLARGR